MTAALVQKILASLVILTTIFMTFIFAVFYDLRRPIGKSLFQLIPGILFFAFGLAVSIILKKPKLIFQNILTIKSGFARSLLGGIVLPYIGTATRTMSIIASLTSLIDKMWFYWLKWRMFYIFRLLCIVCLAIIAGNVVFKIIFVTDQSKLVEATKKLNIIGAWAGSVLGVILALLTILAIPNIFTKKES